MRIDQQEQKFLESNNFCVSCPCISVWERESITLGSSNKPGLRGSHILRMGSEPPAATSAEPSPPISRQLRALPAGCATGECHYLNFKISGKGNAGTRVLKKDYRLHGAKRKSVCTYNVQYIFACPNIPPSNRMVPRCRIDYVTLRPLDRRYTLCMAH